MRRCPCVPAHFEPSPVQSPRIPISVAGVWPNKRTFRRAARWDGVVPLKEGLALGEMMTPGDLREIVTYVRGQRRRDGSFDVVTGGHTAGKDRGRDLETVDSYREAGATWWLESVSPFDLGWSWKGAWPVEEMQERIRQWPPKQ